MCSKFSKDEITSVLIYEVVERYEVTRSKPGPSADEAPVSDLSTDLSKLAVLSDVNEIWRPTCIMKNSR